MTKFSCPACGAEVQFKSRVSVFGVCSYCATMVVRHDMNLEMMGKMAQLPPDMSPLQVGTQGRFEGKGFEIVGRLKIGWDQGSWNEWYTLLDDGRDGWLAEAQGFYMFSFKHADLNGLPDLKKVSPGMTVAIGKEEFQIEDIKQAECVGSEGELPMRGPKGRKSTSVDLNGEDGKFACIDYGEDEVRLYVGRYIDFEKMNLTSLRQVDGW